MGIRHFIGFHGTNDTNAERIIKTNFSIDRTKVGWLGTGVYFYDEDYKMAQYWASDKHKGKIRRIIKSHIQVPKDKVLDMIEPESKHFFHAFRKQLLEKEIQRRKKNIIVKKRKDLDGQIYNAIARTKGYILIRSETYTFQDEDRYFGFQESRVPNSVELCLKNVSYIKDKEYV